MKLHYSNIAILWPQLSSHADAASHIGSDDPEVNVGSEFATGFSSGPGNEEQMPEPLSDESDAGCDTDLEIEGECWGEECYTCTCMFIYINLIHFTTP